MKRTLISEIDVQKLAYERRRTQMLEQRSAPGGIVFSLMSSETKLTRYVAPQPLSLRERRTGTRGAGRF